MRLCWSFVSLIGTTVIAVSATAQTPLSAPHRRALIAHKSVLSSLPSPSPLGQDLEDEITPTDESMFYSNLSSPVELSSQRSLSGSGGYYIASKDGRDLEIGEWTLGARFNPRLSAWFGHQSISAKGRTRVPRRSSFNASAEHFGLRWVLKGTEAQGLSLQYDAYHSGQGDVEVGTSSALLPGPKTDIFALIYTPKKSSEDGLHLPIPRLKASVTNLQGIGAGMTSLGLGGGVSFKVAKHLTGDADLTGFFEKRRNNTNALNFRTQLSTGLTYQPIPWAKLQAVAEISPFGVPLGGTALTGLSSFGVYQRNDGVSGVSNGAVAVFLVRLVVGHRF